METERYRTEPGGPRYGLQVAKVKAYAVTARQHSVHINSDNRSI
jgi:hypothetical protein